MWRLVSLVLLAAACGVTQVPLRPVPDPREPGGHPGEYRLETSDRQLGTVRVWSRGVYVEHGRNLAHVAIQLESSGRTGMRLDVGALRLVVYQDNEGSAELRPSSTTGTAEIRPRGDGRLDAYFDLPAGMKPADVTALEVTWTAQLGDQTRHAVTRLARFTDRMRGRRPTAHGPIMPGSGAMSPTGEWYSCPEDPHRYYPYPPYCL
jgi:hypothetical protein